ncbi:hypothetical protein EV426DRAFT_574740 [Tirmania nivea]|nr:hypothetical protein EV426DRAFT_574740 [Tirmania nivea]
MTKSSAGKYTDPELRDQIKEEVQAGDKGGKPGQWSARKAQMMASQYKSRGGSYIGPKDGRARHLDQWTREDWQTKDGNANANANADDPDGVSHRYLPKKAWEKMEEEDKEDTEARKVEGSLKGEQFVRNTEKAVEARKEAGEEVREEIEEEEEQRRGKMVGGGGEVEHDAARKRGGKTEKGTGGAKQIFRPKKHVAPEKKKAEEVVDSQAGSVEEIGEHKSPKPHFRKHEPAKKVGNESTEVKAATQHFTPKTHKVNKPKEHAEPTKRSVSKKQKEEEEIEEGGEEFVEEPVDDGSEEYKPENEGDVATEEEEVHADTATMDEDEDMTHSEAERILDAEETAADTATREGAIDAEVSEEEYSPDIETTEEVIEDEDYVDEDVDEEPKQEEPQPRTKKLNREEKGQEKLEGRVSKPGLRTGSGKHAGDKRKAGGGGEGQKEVHQHEAVDPRTKAGQTEKKGGKQVFKPKKQKTGAS